MLDGEDAVVSAKAEIGDEVTPICLVISVADGTEYPRAVNFIAVVLCVKNTVFGGIVLVDLGILCMDVVDSTLKFADSGNGVHPLPNKVRGVEISTEVVSAGISEAEKCFGVVYAETGMHFKRYTNAVFGAEFTGLFPIRNELLIPLPIMNRKEVLGPGAGYPVGVLRAFAVAGAAGEADNGVNTELFCKKSRITDVLVISCGNLRVGVNGVSMACESADLNVVFFECCNELVVLFLIGEKLCGVAGSLSGITARTDLDSVNAERGDYFESFIE